MISVKRSLGTRLYSLLRRDDTRVAFVVLIGFGVVLAAIDVIHEPPEWKHVLAELHGVWVEIALIAVVAAIWIQRRERKHWRAVRPVIVAQVLRACNAGLETVYSGTHHKCVYQIGEYDVACSFELDRLWRASLDKPRQRSDALTQGNMMESTLSDSMLSELRLLATTFLADNSNVLLIRSKSGQAQALADSALHLAGLVVSRGVEAEEVADIARLQDALSALHSTANIITGVGDHSEDERHDAHFAINRDLMGIIDICLSVGGPLAAGATKTSWEAAESGRLDTLKDRVRRQLEVQAGQDFVTYEDAAIWASREDN